MRLTRPGCAELQPQCRGEGFEEIDWFLQHHVTEQPHHTTGIIIIINMITEWIVTIVRKIIVTVNNNFDFHWILSLPPLSSLS
mmetsp:Transcript_19614/g.45642  ORF Transcript_19614/g.45642 Transcript_19614/m.45642 type:complete len:83 (+) Transcript_19614:617-865(+)